MPKVSDLFEIHYGHSLSLNRLELSDPGQGIAFVSRTARNNGVSAWVKPVAGVTPLPPGLLTVCLRSRNYALATFLQPRPFYCGFHVYVLRPRSPMSLQERLWWGCTIEANRFRYNFGRQANRTLADLQLPAVVPNWVDETPLPEFSSAKRMLSGHTLSLNTSAWPQFAWALSSRLRVGVTY